MKSREKVEEILKKVTDRKHLPSPVIAGVIISHALLYIGDVLNKHLTVIAKNTKELKNIAKGMKK